MRILPPLQVASRTPARVRRVVLYLIKPSRYDDDGYVIRHWKGVIPSNTLSTLNGLTQDVKDSGALGHVDIQTHLLDEAVHRVPYRRIQRDARRAGTKVIVCLCGVQSNQYPRAQDLARRFRRDGLTVLIGGFHVSGANALLPGVEPELEEMMRLGVTLVRGEVDDCWGAILKQAVEDSLPPMVDKLNDRPDLYRQPIPVLKDAYLKRFALPDTGTIDAGRGCPFACTFCTIINVQGRKMRHRSPEHIIAAMKKQYAQGTRFYFFTDDNFARNPEWEGVFDGLIRLREEGYRISFMMQVDTLAWKIDNFIEKAAAAGCLQVFIGLESIRADNLSAAGKRQNKVADFRKMIDAWHEAKIVTHCGYILGFPHDTPASIVDDVRRLKDEIGADVASFFILTPLPGSQDHAEVVARGVKLDGDLNQYDSFHPVMDHPHMSREALSAAYQRAWKDFFTVEHMKRSLKRLRGSESYWQLFNVYFWYRNSSEMGEHPMMSGFYRFRDRIERRATFPRERYLPYLQRRLGETFHQVRIWWTVLLEMQEVWLATRIHESHDGRLQAIFKAMLTVRPRVALSGMMAWLHRRRYTREDLTEFWRSLRRMQWLRANPLRAPLNAVRESTVMVHFMLDLVHCWRRNARVPMRPMRP